MTRSSLVVLALVVSACGNEEAERQLREQEARAAAPQVAEVPAAQARPTAEPISPEHAAQLQQQGVTVTGAPGAILLAPVDESQRLQATGEGASPVEARLQP